MATVHAKVHDLSDPSEPAWLFTADIEDGHALVTVYFTAEDDWDDLSGIHINYAADETEDHDLHIGKILQHVAGSYLHLPEITFEHAGS
jgi:hypothetical protein